MFTAGLVGCLTVILALAFSWICTCGLVYLITLCFGWTFTWAIATGVWLLGMLLSGIFKTVVHK